MHATLIVLALMIASTSDSAPARWRSAPWFVSGLEPPSRAWAVPMAWKGRIVTLPWLHVGVRAAALYSPDETAIAATVQVSLGLP